MKLSEVTSHAVTLPLQGNAALVVVQVADVTEALRGFTWDKGAGQYVVCINAALPDEQKARTCLHEVSHVLLGHFEQSAIIAEQEETADDRAASLFDLWLQGETSFEVELLKQWIEKRGQVVPLRV